MRIDNIVGKNDDGLLGINPERPINMDADSEEIAMWRSGIIPFENQNLLGLSENDNLGLPFEVVRQFRIVAPDWIDSKNWRPEERSVIRLL